MNTTNLQDARALKRMGMPLNTPVERREFSEAYSKQWLGLMKAHGNFCGALAGYIEVSSAPKWRKLRKSVDGIFNAMERADAAIDEFTNPHEQMLMADS
jgi:hypothetical protein